MSIVAEQYEFVIGVDTHAATHTLSVITAATGAVIDQAVLMTLIESARSCSVKLLTGDGCLV